MTENLYLIGFMGAGKSAVSRCLARLLSIPCIDTDQEIEERQGKKITEIFAESGEESFRDMETALLREIASGGPCIVSCGGGLVLREENRRLMRESGRTVWLTASPETIYERVRLGRNRPLLNGRMNTEEIARLLAERQERYEKAAEVCVPTDGRTIEEIASELQRSFFPSAQDSGERP